MAEMGYSYNLTVRNIAQNRAAIAENPLGGVFTDMADRAFAFGGRALDAGLIDRETLTALERMPPK